MAIFSRSKANETRRQRAILDFVEYCSPTVYRLAYGIVGPAGIEEIVQEICVELIRRAVTKRHGTDLKIWLYRTILATLEQKQRGASCEAVALEAFLPTYDVGGHRQGDRDFLLADWSRVPDETLLSEEGRANVRGAFSRLPVDARIVLLLRDVEALPSDEVAEILGVTSAVINTRVHRARMALRELLTAAAVGSTGPGPAHPESRDGRPRRWQT